jgi:hypothetical protein
VVERSIGEWQGTRVSDLEVDAGIVILALRIVDVHLREVQTAHAANPGVLGQAEAETARAAADIQDALGPDYPGEVNEEGCEPTAPPPHLQLVPVAIRGDECR